MERQEKILQRDKGIYTEVSRYGTNVQIIRLGKDLEVGQMTIRES